MKESGHKIESLVTWLAVSLNLGALAPENRPRSPRYPASPLTGNLFLETETAPQTSEHHPIPTPEAAKMFHFEKKECQWEIQDCQLTKTTLLTKATVQCHLGKKKVNEKSFNCST